MTPRQRLPEARNVAGTTNTTPAATSGGVPNVRLHEKRAHYCGLWKQGDLVSADQPDQAAEQDEERKRHVRSPRLQDGRRADGDVARAHDSHPQRQRPQAAPTPRNDGCPHHGRRLEHDEPNLGGPRRAAEQRRKRGDQPERQRPGVIPAVAAVGPNEGDVAREHVADPQIDHGEVLHRQVRPTHPRDDGGHERQQHNHRDDDGEPPVVAASSGTPRTGAVVRFRQNNCVSRDARTLVVQIQRFNHRRISTRRRPR